MPKVLIIEDDEATRRGLSINFRDEGYDVVTHDRGALAVEAVLTNNPDLIVLDVMLPVTSGFDVCRGLRRLGINTPVILLTAKTEEVSRVLGLDMGADDYVGKPFSIRELLARARVQLRRRANSSIGRTEAYRFDDIEIDFGNRSVMRGGKQIVLTRREFDVLEYLVQNRGELITRSRLLRDIWGYHESTATRTLDTHILKLRQKLQPDPAKPSYILSAYGIGYKFVG